MKYLSRGWCPRCQKMTTQTTSKPFGCRITETRCIECNNTLSKQYDKGINKITDKQKIKNDNWAKIVRLKMVNTGFHCEECGSKGDFRSLRGHHKEFRRHNNNTYANCVILCGFCHSMKHGIKEIK